MKTTWYLYVDGKLLDKTCNPVTSYAFYFLAQRLRAEGKRVRLERVDYSRRVTSVA